VPADTPEVCNLAAGKVPLEILEAFVVSVVADAARPLTAPEAIVICVAVTDDILPFASTTILGT